MLQVVYEKDFRIIRCQDAMSGAEDSWVVYATKNFPEEPRVFKSLIKAAEWIEVRAGTKPAAASFQQGGTPGWDGGVQGKSGN